MITSTSFAALTISFGMIFINEMGDKSQLIAMAFATKYKLYKVITGIFLACILLNSIAVFFGTLLANFSYLESYINFISAILFLLFCVLTLKGENGRTEKVAKPSSMPQILLIFVPFFLSEIGDKTQIVTVTLSARFNTSWFFVFLGSTLGMIFADSIGIFFGKVLHKKVPSNVLNIVSASLFLFFGVSAMFSWLSQNCCCSLFKSIMISGTIGIFTLILAFVIYIKSNKA